MQADLVGISLSIRRRDRAITSLSVTKTARTCLLNKPFCLARAADGSQDRQGGPQRQIRLHRAGALRSQGHTADVRYHDCRVRDRPRLAQPGVEKPGLRASGRADDRIEELIGKGKNQVSMAEVDVDAAAAYAAADAEITLRLMPILREELERVGGMKLMEEIEMPLISVLAEMEMSGILLDLLFFAGMSQNCRAGCTKSKTSLPVGWQGVQSQLHPAALGRAFQPSAPGAARPGKENRQRALFHSAACWKPCAANTK
jgi:DNA polymerase I